MTTLIPSLSWQDQSDARAPVASSVLDFSQDTTFEFPNLNSSYHFNPIFPNGVFVDNTQNVTAVMVQYGAQTIDVPSFTSANIEFPKSTSSVKISCGNPQQVPITFYIVPVPGAGVNFAGATKTVPEANAFVTKNVTNDPVVQKSTGIATVVKRSPGFYTVVMSPPMPDLNYTVLLTCVGNSITVPNEPITAAEDSQFVRTTVQFGVITLRAGGTVQDNFTGLSIKVIG